MRFDPCGDAALLVTFDDTPAPALSRSIADLQAQLAAAPTRPAGFLEAVPGFTTLLLIYDPAVTDAARLRAEFEALHTATNAPTAPREWTIPVCYDETLAPDLADVAHRCGLTPEAVIDLHSGREYAVYLLGFSPGFPYLGDLPAALALPRRAEPRARVPAGAVAIATQYTAIYPQATPGGWHVIGRTPLALFDARRMPPALLRPGDTVRFTPISLAEYESGQAVERTP